MMRGSKSPHPCPPRWMSLRRTRPRFRSHWSFRPTRRAPARPPPPKAGAKLPDPAALRLRLSDASRTMLDEQPLRAAIAAPDDYLEATRVEFVPDAAGQPNRLAVTLRALPALAGPPCPVELVLP